MGFSGFKQPRHAGSFGLLMALVLVSLLGCQKTQMPKQKPLTKDAKVLAFGDSLTFGIGVLPEDSYPARLQALIQRTVINGGVAGELSGEGLKRLPIWLDEYEPSLLILCHGANDLLRSLSEEKAAANLKAMVKMARDRGIDVLLIAVPKFGVMRTPPKFYEAIGREFDIPVETFALEQIVRHKEYHSDSVHPNPKGYQLIADSVLKDLRQSGAIQTP